MNKSHLLYESLCKTTSFYEWEDLISKYDNQHKGLLFELFTFYVMKIHPYYEPHIQEIFMFDDIPNHLIEHFQLPTKDKGIDLICKINNEWNAVQVKYRTNTERIIPFNELATFTGLSFGRFNKGILVTNCDNVPDELKTTQLSFICGDFWRTIDNDMYNHIKLYSNKPSNLHIHIPKIIYQPFEHQLNAEKYSVEHFKNNDNGTLLMACGTGKTFTSNLITTANNFKHIIVAVPSLYLLSQIMKKID